jgi:DNA-directed RNA polymerase subunit M/transcription elongation factor TFIIS
MEDVALQLGIDIERRTTRGRSCPRCGGKIIPSRRAVYQSTGDPNAIFPSWQCERCGYEELINKPVKAAPKHAAKAAENKAATAQQSASGVAPAGSGASPVMTPEKPPAARAVPVLKDSKGRSLPPDVNRMMAEMTKKVDSRE